MRWLLAIVIGVLVLLTIAAETLMQPQRTSGTDVIDSYFAVGRDTEHSEVNAIMAAFDAAVLEAGLPPVNHPAELLALGENDVDGAMKAQYRRAFAKAYIVTTGESLEEVTQLVWSTGPNPARRVQMALFRVWHLRTFGEPIDIVADPSNRDLTKAIVQSVAGAGPDLIEYIGAAHLQTLVNAGIAHDLTEYAREHGFAPSTVFPAAVSSIALQDDLGELRQYGYPCNLDYKVLLIHQDLFEQAGEPLPEGGWTFETMKAVGARVLASDQLSVRPQYAIMNLGPISAAQGGGGRFFADDRAGYSIWNSPETVRGLRAYQDMMYVDRVMPRPAEAASMSAATAGGFGGSAGVSAPGLFAQRSILMHVGGRWEYVVFASANRDRVYLPAIDRALAELDPATTKAALLRSVRVTLLRDVLLPLADEQYAALESVLTEDDRRAMLTIQAVHIPTLLGDPFYTVSARSTVVNRVLEEGDTDRLEKARRFIRFLSSQEYNEQVNGTFDSIAGRLDFATSPEGIAASPRALPGLEGFDSAVFAEAVLQHGHSRQLSDYIGRHRMLTLVTEVMEDLQSNTITPEQAARQAEESINRQILANLKSDARLRAQWIEAFGIDPAVVEFSKPGPDGQPITIRDQIESLRASQPDSSGADA